MSEYKQPRMSPGMRETLEVAMELSGQPQRPSFLTKLFTPAQPEQGAVIAELVEALDEAEDYFENRADADCDQDGYVPNQEMVLLTKIRSAFPKPNPTNPMKGREMSEQSPIKVRPLEWSKADDGGEWAYNAVTGGYKVMQFRTEWIAIGLGPYQSEEEAKEACFKRHETAILSQIET